MAKKILFIKTMKKPLDNLAELLIKGFGDLNVPIDVYNGEAKVNFDDYDTILATSLRWDNIDIVSEAQKQAQGRLYFIDGEDDPFIRAIYKHANVYFKREKLLYPRARSNLAKPYDYIKHATWTYLGDKRLGSAIKLVKNMKICSLAFQTTKHKLQSINLTATKKPNEAPLDKLYDICFIISPGNAFREGFAKQLSAYCTKKGHKAYISTSGGVPAEEYVRIIRQSKTALSLRGLGWDTYRYYDIASLGTCLISEYLPIEIQNNFINKEEAVFFDDFSDFTRKFEWALKNNWQEIGDAGKEKFDLWHVPTQRAQRVLNTIYAK
jgi:hypothetical protein